MQSIKTDEPIVENPHIVESIKNPYIVENPFKTTYITIRKKIILSMLYREYYKPLQESLYKTTSIYNGKCPRFYFFVAHMEHPNIRKKRRLSAARSSLTSWNVSPHL